jgi:hypothetical protein
MSFIVETLTGVYYIAIGTGLALTGVLSYWIWKNYGDVIKEVLGAAKEVVGAGSGVINFVFHPIDTAESIFKKTSAGSTTTDTK